MKRQTLARASRETIDEAVIDLSFERYEQAKEKFEKVVKDLEDKMLTITGLFYFKAPLHTAAFGLGLVEGTEEYEKFTEPRSIGDVAKTAKNLYDTFMAYGDSDSYLNNPGDYKAVGRGYAHLGLIKEGMIIIERGRDTGILDSHTILDEQRSLGKEE